VEQRSGVALAERCGVTIRGVRLSECCVSHLPNAARSTCPLTAACSRIFGVREVWRSSDALAERCAERLCVERSTEQVLEAARSRCFSNARRSRGCKRTDSEADPMANVSVERWAARQDARCAVCKLGSFPKVSVRAGCVEGGQDSPRRNERNHFLLPVAADGSSRDISSNLSRFLSTDRRFFRGHMLFNAVTGSVA